MASRKDMLLAYATVPPLAFMVLWVFVYPASYRVGWWPGYTARMARLVAQPCMPAPLDVITKYESHTAVKLTHLLPSGVWALCGAVQLLPGVRSARPWLHRMSGRLMLLSAAAVFVGYFLIEARGLIFDAPVAEFYNSGAPGDALGAATAGYVDAGRQDGASGGRNGGTGGGGGDDGGGIWTKLQQQQPANIAGLRAIALWFALTGGMAGYHARRRRYAAHRRWAVRHLAAGGWVIVQRLFIGCAMLWARATGLAWSMRQRHELFGAAGATAIALCLAGAEVFFLATGKWDHADAGRAK
ncbi:hypothetical protein GPECTOR_41g657 [Gonium pectorale]|uniref:Uncharacterized protein n=1 Tax=Gonium pectorale TaxID=33097 RepID=A0A150GA96_GONPE|nr:hypothetical protein GPECTOR_41g657 [Gonium pectorale]|eukprot:KXZ46693.1 hypothetical protein GPECTOR_41g657 [Gonium pectorale]